MKQRSMMVNYTNSEPSPLFAQMLRENSERALEWLRAADYMPDDGERYYCLKRALLLDPTDTNTQSQLWGLERIHVHHNADSSLLSSLQHFIQSIRATEMDIWHELYS